MSLACCYVPFSTLVTHVSTRVIHHASVPAGGAPGPTAADWTTAISTAVLAFATIVLAAFAIVTAYYARKAFREQSKEVKDQADMLEVQSKRLDEERKVNEEHIRVLKLQARELEESLAERKREAEQRAREAEERARETRQLERAQASKVHIETEVGPDPRFGVIPRAASIPAPETVTVRVTNTSDQPIYNADIIWDDGSMGFLEFAVWPGAEHLALRIDPGETASRTKLPTDTPDARDAVLRFRDAAGVPWLRTAYGSLERFTGGPSGGWPGPVLTDRKRVVL